MGITVEAHFAQQLASNQPHIREKALKKLGKWFERISVSTEDLNEETFLKIWKGLYYYFWHCDKMLVQEERADVISQFIHAFKTMEYSFLYIDTFFTTMSHEWHCIDHYRIEKFMMLVRKFLHQCFQLLKRKHWKVKCIKEVLNILKKTVLAPSTEGVPYGLKTHISDIYMEELAKVGHDEVTPKILRKFLLPYCNILCYSEDASVLQSVKKDVFLYLINQDADEAEFHEFPVLKFNPNSVQKLLMKHANQPDVKRKNLKIIHSIVKEYEDYKSGINAFEKILKSQQTNRKLRKRAIEKASLKLVEEEEVERNTKKAFKKKRKINSEIIDLVKWNAEIFMLLTD
ncbi:Ribosomal RNA processing protein 1 like protein [Argiope bruennichi]|uniref:Ribosomal RNA processing protein 1 like protein n=2 Tax=Argiope bruennichi TaxID=94029 RepID=A0A8T0EH25_ARGBR|nr:Ribosomal RNA processing protein 1 like protein [Argiope bruennichi]